MNAPLHTPGPWMANFTRMNGDAIHWHVADKKRGTVNAVAVADEEQGKMRSASELEANAHLIAAAPDLLAVLTSMNHMGGDERGGYCICPLNDGSAPDHKHATVCVDARTAITKATGAAA